MFSKINRAFKKSRAEDGFTLIELLIVIVIIGILAAIAIPVFLNAQNAAHDATVKSDARNTVIGVATALVTKPDATGFMVLAPSDTTAAVKLAGVPSVVVTVPAGAVAVRGVVTKSNWVTVRGTGADYVVHAQSTVDGFWYEFKSKTGKYTSSSDTPAVTPGVPSSTTPVGNSVQNPDGIAVRVDGPPVTTIVGAGGTAGTGASGPSSNTAAFAAPVTVTALRWSIVASDSTGMKLVALTEPTQMYQVSNILRSTDGGKNWGALPLTPQQEAYHWQDIASSADGTHLAAASQYGFYVSLDSGATWTKNTTVGAGDNYPHPKTVSVSADGQKMVFSEPNLSKVWVSTNAGTTWTSTAQTGGQYNSSSGAHFSTAVIAPDGTKIVAGVTGTYGTGRLWTSLDSGATWGLSHAESCGAGYGCGTFIGTPGWDSLSSSSDGQKLVTSIPDETGWAGERVAISTDGGIVWNDSSLLGSTSKWATASSLNGNVLAVGSSNGYIYISIDGGATWKSQTSAGVGNWTSLSLSADGTHLAAINVNGATYLVTATL